MGTSVLRWSEYPSVPWKNGGGITREVASGVVRTPLVPAEFTVGFDWRVSVADVDAQGPFSSFPGIDRVITLVEGDGMVLTVEGTAQSVAPLVPFAFSGDAATDCRLEAGAVRDMNVMTRRGRAAAHVRILPVSVARAATMVCPAGETLLVMAVTEGITVAAPDGHQAALGPLDCVRHEGPGPLTLSGDGSVAEIRIAPAR
ncbi:HutD family protein [Streptomyces kanamyceticus]|uniref:HutD family protein n=1 Tax=Streptomyces kanamyceticus TaxID=1967 RepID=A0A5J6GPK5_STRKN|nr:HutD family protein [Streptomyces kanamyceticus]QEU96913.1 HutD family protein [Streptomyces kanamyceticus]